MSQTEKNSDGYLELIIGPMFSGKTTRLIELYNEKTAEFGKENCLAINYELDRRYTDENKIISHDKLAIDCYSLYDLQDLIDEDENKLQNVLIKSKYIFINEAQFFPNLKNIIIFCKNTLKKHIVLCGLDLDFKREKFGELMDLLPYANSVNRLTGKCNTPECCFPSRFSHRTIKFDNQLLIGSDCYVPLCRLCYNKENSMD